MTLEDKHGNLAFLAIGDPAKIILKIAMGLASRPTQRAPDLSV